MTARKACGRAVFLAARPDTHRGLSHRFVPRRSNSLESVDEGMIHSEQNVYTEYADPRRTEWITKIQPASQAAKLEMLVARCENKLSRREIIELRAERSNRTARLRNYSNQS
jgi:hypothetical protein